MSVRDSHYPTHLVCRCGQKVAWGAFEAHILGEHMKEAGLRIRVAMDENGRRIAAILKPGDDQVRQPHPRPKDWRYHVVAAVNYYQQISRRGVECRKADQVLIDWGYPPKQADRVLGDAHDEGLIESGVSERTAWLTDRGRALLLSRPFEPVSPQPGDDQVSETRTGWTR